MSLSIRFEHDYQQKIMYQFIDPGSSIDHPRDVLAWRQQWMQELKSWHSPYKCLIDATHMTLNANGPEIIEVVQRMKTFFEGLFLKKAVMLCPDEAIREKLSGWPFETCATEDLAHQAVGIRTSSVPKTQTDFRSLITLQNHFAQHVIELSFAEPCSFDSKEKVAILKSKLMNNLMQWHSKWNLLIDCSNLSWSQEINDDWQQVERFLTGLFMKVVIGYSPRGDASQYPFKVYRSRHKAVADLESEGFFMGNTADCKSKKSQ